MMCKEAKKISRSLMFKTHKFYIIGLFLISLMGSAAAYAQSYKIELKTFDACGVYEAICKSKQQACYSKLTLPFEKAGKYGKIQAEISIINKSVTIEFKAENQILSTALSGWKSYSEDLENFYKEPQIVKLYFPNPAIIGKSDTSLSLTIWPLNAFMTGVLVDVQPATD